MYETSMNIRRVEDPCLRHYMQYVEKYGNLTREEESGLSLRIMSDDRDALDQLVNANLCHVVGIARAFINRGLSDMDVFAVGTLALIGAARGFDGRRGIRFISIAKHQIARALRDAIAKQAHPTRRPSQAVACDVSRLWKAPLPMK